ncbi:MAG: tRNA pseudouridine(55) synthase TruB [Acholeplasmatales bacterium]|nr:tRNA pseudouridine(55) synthase TruB [Acholeplasmatales bacterium]
MDGFIIIDKEKDFTSFDVCNKIRHKFFTSHVGHTGTLDPNATGVLVVSLGKGCKTLNLLEEHDKSYLCTIEFGKSYDTIDPTGKLVSESFKEIDIEALKKAVDKVALKESQIPPKYSALKIKGKRAYDLAREGKDFEIKERPAHVYEARIESQLKKIDNCYYVDIYLKVSKGFYIRSFVRDVAEELGVDANMFNLRRLSSGIFKIENSKKLNDITEDDIIPIAKVFSYLPHVELKEYLLPLIKNGVQLDSRQTTIDSPFVAVINGKEIAIYKPGKNKGTYSIEVLL